MAIVLSVLGKPSETHTIQHDLNFLQDRYEADHPVVRLKHHFPSKRFHAKIHRPSRTQNRNSSPSSVTAGRCQAKRMGSRRPTQLGNAHACTRA